MSITKTPEIISGVLSYFVIKGDQVYFCSNVYYPIPGRLFVYVILPLTIVVSLVMYLVTLLILSHF